MGSVVNAVVRSKITLIGKTGGDIGEFGRQDKRTGDAIRTGRKYPRQILVPGYGIVYPMSLDYGRWRSGTVVVTKVLDGPLQDYTIRYMHLATVRPDLKVGDIVEAGEHLALMGSTAVMDSPPHVHIDMETPTGARDDLAPYIGLKETKSHCGSSKSSKNSKKSTKSSKTSSKKSSGKSTKTSGASKTVSGAGITKRSRESYVQKATASAVAPETRELQR
ncbi:MAG: peptidoglycan DD-metalloendopeptidase family protein [Proteobacteria bacterium]|nr:peptidoglycan DD-metalloendopeptidase family protein [Pseudomonadota bacterium]